MPYTADQNKTFRALEHGWKPKSGKLASLVALGREKLRKMAHEGIKDESKKK